MEESNLVIPDVECISLRELPDKFKLPAVQRGLVWDALKIGNLWDSLAKGYPIGAFIAYEENGTLQLLDGQQRLNSILIAFDRGLDNNSVLWVKLEEGSGCLKFMVCTPNNPWGFQKDGSRFVAGERAMANIRFLKKPFRRFAIASVNDSYPWEGRLENNGVVAIKYVPMSLLCTKDNGETAYASYQDMLLRLGLDINHVGRKEFDTLYDRIQTILETKICVIVSKKIPQNVVELFQRINKGGERLSGPDEVYSTLCAYCGGVIKDENNKIADMFMPPERLMQIALRMAKTMGDGGKFCDHEIGCDDVKKWFSDDKFRNYRDSITQIYRRDGANRSAFSVAVEQLKRHFRTANIPLLIFLNRSYCWESWLLVLILLLKDGRIKDRDESYFPLLAMLPYTMSTAMPYEKADHVFCSAFYNAVSRLPVDTGLLKVIAVGLSCAMTKKETFVFPWPAEQPDHSVISDLLTDWMDGNITYYGRWITSILKYCGTRENPLLFYHQRKYVNEIVEGTRFNPAFRCATDARNRPWDMDHIFPSANWDPQDDYRDVAGNMQVMYFSDNRSKGNRCNGYSSDIEDGADYFGYSMAASDSRMGYLMCPSTKEESDWKKFIVSRMLQIIRELYEQLKLVDLIAAINELPNDSSLNIEELNNAITRYKMFSGIVSSDLEFACVQYKWKQQNKSVEEADVAAIPIGRNLSFYQSLTPWLGLYLAIESEKPSCQIWASCSKDCEFGVGRACGMNNDQWRKHNANRGWYVSKEVCLIDEAAERFAKFCREKMHT